MNFFSKYQILYSTKIEFKADMYIKIKISLLIRKSHLFSLMLKAENKRLVHHIIIQKKLLS